MIVRVYARHGAGEADNFRHGCEVVQWLHLVKAATEGRHDDPPAVIMERA